MYTNIASNHIHVNRVSSELSLVSVEDKIGLSVYYMFLQLSFLMQNYVASKKE